MAAGYVVWGLIAGSDGALREHPATLNSASNLFVSLLRLGENAGATVLLRTALTVRIPHARGRNQSTLITEGLLVHVLHRLGEHADAGGLLVEALSGSDAPSVENTARRPPRPPTWQSCSLGKATTPKPRRANARSSSTTRMLGAKHEEMLISALNLDALSRRGQDVETEQLLRGTSTLSLRALGPFDEAMQLPDKPCYYHYRDHCRTDRPLDDHTT